MSQFRCGNELCSKHTIEIVFNSIKSNMSTKRKLYIFIHFSIIRKCRRCIFIYIWSIWKIPSMLIDIAKWQAKTLKSKINNIEEMWAIGQYGSHPLASHEVTKNIIHCAGNWVWQHQELTQIVLSLLVNQIYHILLYYIIYPWLCYYWILILSHFPHSAHSFNGCTTRETVVLYPDRSSFSHTRITV